MCNCTTASGEGAPQLYSSNFGTTLFLDISLGVTAETKCKIYTNEYLLVNTEFLSATSPANEAVEITSYLNGADIVISNPFNLNKHFFFFLLIHLV